MSDDVLRRRHGSGTYVTERPLLRNDLSLNFGVAEMIASTGLEHGTSYSHAAREGAPADVAEAFGIETGAPLAVRATKRNARYALTHSPEETAAFAREHNARVTASEDFREGARAFAEKRRPEWRGR